MKRIQFEETYISISVEEAQVVTHLSIISSDFDADFMESRI